MGVHSRTPLDDTAVERPRPRANGSDRLAPVIRVFECLSGPTSGVQRVSGVGAEEGLGSLGDDEAIKGVGANARINSIDTIGVSLGDDDRRDALLVKLGLEVPRLREGFAVINGSEDANPETSNRGQRVLKDREARSSVVVVIRGVRVGDREAESRGYTRRDVVADLVQLRDDVVLDRVGLDIAGLEPDGVDYLLLLGGGKGVVEEAGLRPVVVEGRREGSDVVPLKPTLRRGKEAIAVGLIRLPGQVVVKRVGRVWVDEPDQQRGLIFVKRLVSGAGNLQWIVLPWIIICAAPSRLLLWTSVIGRLMGICSKLGPPWRLS